jgi:hypothetical protein
VVKNWKATLLLIAIGSGTVLASEPCTAAGSYNSPKQDKSAAKTESSAKDAQELGRMARDKSYAGSLSAAGEVKKQDVQSSFNREMLDKLNIFAQTTNQFANLVVQATPQLDANVKAAQANVESSSKQVQSLPDGKTR